MTRMIQAAKNGGLLLLLTAVLAPALAVAQEAAAPPTLSAGDTAWMLTPPPWCCSRPFRAVAVLRRHGACQERAVSDDAVLRHYRADHRAVGAVWLQPGVRCHWHDQKPSICTLSSVVSARRS